MRNSVEIEKKICCFSLVDWSLYL